MKPYMVDQYIHIYEKIGLFPAGVCMGLALVVGHLVAALWPRELMELLGKINARARFGQALLIFDLLWVALLLWDSPLNPLRMELFDFNIVRMPLLIACPLVGYTLCTYSKQNLFGRAVGLFLLLLGIVPLSAAYLKEPCTRLLIPLWWYPVLTYAIFLVPMPWLLRDTFSWLAKRPALTRTLALAGLLYGLAILICAFLYW